MNMIDQLCNSDVMHQLFCEPLSYPFMQHALEAVILIGIVAGVVGAFVVVRGMAFLADALGHAISPGVAVAYFIGGTHGPLLVGALIAGSVTAVVIGFFTRGGKLREDSVIGIVFTGALALGLAIMSLHKSAVDLEELLVGNILAVGAQDIVAIAAIGLVILLLVRVFYKELVLVSFDPVLGATLQYPVEGLRYLLLLMLAMTAVIAFQTVGVVLIAAMLVTPASTAYLLTRRLPRMMFLGAAISTFSGVVGVFLAWHLQVSASAAIVLTMTALFALAYLFAPERGLVWNWKINMQKAHVLVAILILAISLMTPCLTHAQDKKLTAVASITIIQDIAKNVAGDKINVDYLVPTNGDVHQFEPAPVDVKKIADADLMLVNGAGLEQFLDKLISDSGTNGKVITVSRGLPIQRFVSNEQRANTPTQAATGSAPTILGISGSYQCGAPQSGQDIGECDPHLWQNVTNAIVYTLNIRDAFIAADPTDADTFNINAGNYIAKLQKLDADLFAGLAQISAANRVLVTNHDALGYFATRYGFQIAGVVLPGGNTNQDPDPQQVAALIDSIKTNHIKAIFLENVSSDKLAQQIADGSGATVVKALYTDALGDPGTAGDTYVGMMYANLKTLQAALK